MLLFGPIGGMSWPEIYLMCACLGVIWYILFRVTKRQALRRYNVVITGGSRGLGFAMANAFLR